jgi:DNA-binding IclR family transcriptional regulator
MATGRKPGTARGTEKDEAAHGSADLQMEKDSPGMESQGKDRQFVTALARGLDILRCFSRTRPALGTAEIARLTGLPQPTVWRLCYTLLQEGFLTMGEQNRLKLGIPVLSLGYAVLGETPIADLARPYMQEIALRHQGAVSLGARDRTDMVYLQRCQGSSIILGDLRVGSRVPLATSVTGWAYLAGLGDAERESLCAELARTAPGWADLRLKIDQALKEFELSGYVVNKGSLHPQVNAVAVPLRAEDGKTLLSLSSGGISQLFDDDKLREIGEELRQLSALLRPALGAAPG